MHSENRNRGISRTGLAVFAFSLSLLSSCTYYFGNGLKRSFPDAAPFSVSTGSRPNPMWDAGHPLIQYWASLPLPETESIKKSDAGRSILAKLSTGQEIWECNQFLLSLKPWSKPGTDWFLNPNGDYDFAMVILAAILWKFEDKSEVLWPETQKHIAENLLVFDGGKPHLHTPHTLGLMRETENHILMGECARYLKNQWLKRNGSNELKYNNLENGLQTWWINHLQEKLRTGFFEFNAVPYSGYSLSALLILNAFCESNEIRQLSNELLDRCVREYSYGSLDYRRYPPFRRRLERESDHTFSDDPLSSMMMTWANESDLYRIESIMASGKLLRHHSLIALVCRYRPARSMAEFEAEVRRTKEATVFNAFGHGSCGSPEIYSRGPNWLLSAGGVQRGKASQIVARPTVLFLRDGADSLGACFHLPGKGKMKDWNNTGVHDRFACGPMPVFIPENYFPIEEDGPWKLFESPQKDFYFLVCSGENFGLIEVINDLQNLQSLGFSPPSILASVKIANENRDLSKSYQSFKGTLYRYKLHSPKGQYLIREMDGKSIPGKYDHWSRVYHLEPSAEVQP